MLPVRRRQLALFRPSELRHHPPQQPPTHLQRRILPGRKPPSCEKHRRHGRLVHRAPLQATGDDARLHHLLGSPPNPLSTPAHPPPQSPPPFSKSPHPHP